MFILPIPYSVNMTFQLVKNDYPLDLDFAKKGVTYCIATDAEKYISRKPILFLADRKMYNTFQTNVFRIFLVYFDLLNSNY